jgi:apolipoprotein N-acyltransferase
MDMLRYAGRYESYLITGSIRYEYAKPGRPNKIFDHVSLIHPNGTIMGAYDKHHLVPFGEYMPFRFLGLGKLTHGSLDYSPGKGNQTITVPGGTSFSPLVCYEIVFPGKMVATDAPRPQWILNLTNDAWFGRSFGPYQHLRIAQVRAIEEKMAVVRCSNNGISGVVDPCGRIVASLGLDEMGVVDHYIPAPLD